MKKNAKVSIKALFHSPLRYSQIIVELPFNSINVHHSLQRTLFLFYLQPYSPADIQVSKVASKLGVPLQCTIYCKLLPYMPFTTYTSLTILAHGNLYVLSVTWLAPSIANG